MKCGTAPTVSFTKYLRLPPACFGCSSRHLQRSDGNSFRIELVHQIPEFVPPLGDVCGDLAIAARSGVASPQSCDQDRVNGQRVPGGKHARDARALRRERRPSARAFSRIGSTKARAESGFCSRRRGKVPERHVVLVGPSGSSRRTPSPNRQCEITSVQIIPQRG